MLKKSFFLAILSLWMHTSFGQVTPVQLSFHSANQLIIRNTDATFSYHVLVYKKDRVVHEVLLLPSSAQVFSYPFKRKRRVRQFSVVTRYDEQARDADISRYRSLMDDRIRQANTIEATCLNEERQRQGWLLVTEGVLLGESRWLGALYTILRSPSLDEVGLTREIELLVDELESSTLSTGRRTWLQGLVNYFKRLLQAKVAPYAACPDLQNRKLNLLMQAQTFREGFAQFNQKFTAEQGNSSTESVWSKAQNRQVFTPSFTGFGIEASVLAIQPAVVAKDQDNQPINVASLRTGSHFNGSVLIPLSRPFRGFLWHMPARISAVGSFGQFQCSFQPTAGHYLGLQKSDGSIPLAVDNSGQIDIRTNSGAIGFRYSFMPADRMWLSWEFGGIWFNNTKLTIQSSSPVQVVNNRVVSVLPSDSRSDTPSSSTQLTPYGKIQFSVALFPLANRTTYPNRKKVVAGFSYGLSGATGLPINGTLTQITTGKNNQVSQLIPLTISSLSSVSLGLYAYL
ncbi:hypothetical protein GCM10028805_33050 [Spirosoma harenae]